MIFTGLFRFLPAYRVPSQSCLFTFTLHPEVTGGVFLIEITSNLHGCSTGHAGNRGKDVECGAHVLPELYLCDSRAIVTCPINQAGSKKETALVCFSTTFLCRIWIDLSTGAEVGRFERFVFLFFSLVCRAFCFCL